ncbi:hypothetical protein GRI58_15080 [Porphyrobacter algicida]|uniref:Uncharacterized protein n=1 Tax=Qipengyuania algicida TaxID=1836209 RepID=A0A845AMN4_9SPHN|nr:hypothetical protein [Qipengyuania algicida]MXP30131.1 hypothetical protein [Qipengyuania algicida]
MSVMFVANFLIALVCIVLAAKLIEAILMTRLVERQARLCAFSFLLGSSFGIKTLPVEAIAGTLLGLLVVWWAFFRREVAHG